MRKTAHIIAVLVLLGFQLMHCGTASAWNQEPHKQINFEAVKLFLNHYALSDMEKYRMGRFDREGVTERYRGIAVASESLLIEPWRGFAPYEIVEDAMTMSQWIAWGGDWADEPHLYSSVRHFYDPLSMWWNVSYLTDQFIFHGWYDAPRIDARSWALMHLDNPFSFRDALFYYKQALEIPDTWVYTGQREFWYHFKLDLEFEPRNPADLRGIYLATAYRGLGETMHLLGDMTQPAHVRNDAHPIDEPIEKALNSGHVKDAAAYPIVDERVAPFLKSAGGQLRSPSDIFQQVALFTNQKFYSLDTIYDGPSMVYPNNIIGEMLRQYQTRGAPLHRLPEMIRPYPSPQLEDLVVGTTMVQSHIRGVKREVKELSGSFTVGEIPMARQRLSFHWFDPDMDTLEKVARLQGLGPYQIPPSYAEKKSWVLMPIAIHACADMMHHFFPTLELKAEYLDLGIQSDEEIGGDEYKRTVIEIDTGMVHHIDQDMAWSEHNLEIKYSGPAKLVFARGETVVRTRKLHFLDGRLDKIENLDGEMVEEPLMVFIPLRDVELVPEEAFYQARNEDIIYLEIRAGSRTFRSQEYTIERKIDVYITQPSRVNRWELFEGASESRASFVASAAPDGVYRYEWNFGDGSPVVTQTPMAGGNATVSHTYMSLADGDVFYPLVRLYDANGVFLGEDTITIRVTRPEGDDDPDPSPVVYSCGWEGYIDYSQLTKFETFTALYYRDDAHQYHGLYLAWYNKDRSQLRYARCYNEGEYHGLHAWWFESGEKLKEENYNNGVLEGMTRGWYRSGAINYEVSYAAGELHGLSRSWYEDGQLRNQGTLVHGKMEGHSISWYANGNKSQETNYSNDKFHGPYATWYENGNPRAKGQHEYGIRTGTWYRYNEDGTCSYSTDGDEIKWGC